MILAIGDSWTYGYNLSNNRCSWPQILSSEMSIPVKVSALPGADNFTICDNAIAMIKSYNPDIIIIGWSGISRIRHSKNPYIQYSLSQVPQEDTNERKEFFKKSTLNNLITNWDNQIKLVEQSTNAQIIHFSVFGDQKCITHKNLLKISMLEYLASKQKTKLKYDISIFEFDFLHENNVVAEEFCNRELNSNWIKACIEREDLRGSKMFLDCGHPTRKGHKVWANYLRSII